MLAACLSKTSQAQNKLTFEGLINGSSVGGYYNTGGGGANFGALFDGNAIALTSGASNCDPSTGNGFAGQPSGCNAMVFAGSSTVVSVAAGFIGSVSVYYTATEFPGSLSVYSSLNGSGGSLASTVLATTPVDGASNCFDLPFCPFVKTTLNFAGTAKSIRLGGSEFAIAFDDLTFTTAPEPRHIRTHGPRTRHYRHRCTAPSHKLIPIAA